MSVLRAFALGVVVFLVLSALVEIVRGFLDEWRHPR